MEYKRGEKVQSFSRTVLILYKTMYMEVKDQNIVPQLPSKLSRTSTDIYNKTLGQDDNNIALLTHGIYTSDTDQARLKHKTSECPKIKSSVPRISL